MEVFLVASAMAVIGRQYFRKLNNKLRDQHRGAVIAVVGERAERKKVNSHE